VVIESVEVKQPLLEVLRGRRHQFVSVGLLYREVSAGPSLTNRRAPFLTFQILHAVSE